MAYKKQDGNARRVQGWLSLNHSSALDKFSKMYGLPISRLLAIAIENEMNKDAPFKISLQLPDTGEYVENSFADEAGKIVKFMKTLRSGISLDFLYILRHDFKIPDSSAFLGGFKECLDHDLIESYGAPATSKAVKDSILYRLKSNTPIVNKKIRREVKDHTQYLRLKKKFEKE